MRGRALILVLAAAACGGSGDTGTPPVQQFGGVRGSVLEEGDAGVAAVAVSLARTGHTTRNTTTDAAGNFAFNSVEVGAWTAAATLPADYEAVGSLSAAVSVTANQNTDVAPFRMLRIPTPPPPPQQPTDTAHIAMIDNAFSPTPVTVSVNTLVRWTNNGAVTHNATSATGAWAAQNVVPGGVFERTLTEAGVYDYECTLHLGMTGRITVQ